MTGGGGRGEPPPPPSEQPRQQPSSNSGGQFLLQLLQKPQSQPPSTTHSHPPHPHHDPAVAAMGPTLHPPWSNPSNSPFPLSNHLPSAPPPWALSSMQPPAPPSSASPFVGNFPLLPHEFQMLGLLGNGKQSHQQIEKQLVPDSRLMFGTLEASLSPEVDGLNVDPKFGVQKVREVVGASGMSNGSEVGFNSNRDWEFDQKGNSHGARYGKNDQAGGGWGRRQQSVQYAPPGFIQKPKGFGPQDSMSPMRVFHHNVVDRELGGWGELNHRNQGNGSSSLGLSRLIDHPGPRTRSKLHSVQASEIEETIGSLHGQAIEEDRRHWLERQESRTKNEVSCLNYRMGGRGQPDESAEKFMGTVIVRDGFERRNGIHHLNGYHNKDFRSDVWREPNAPGQRMRNNRKVVGCRNDINRLNAPFLSIFESLVPTEEEKAKQKQLLTLLEKLVNKEWPKAELYTYGSCANSFGVSNSDIDVCLAIRDVETSKSEILLRLADILQSDNLENVQALTRARVPIVKLMDPVTGVSCDICINNLLAVVNTKLLRDYAQIDHRLRQLAFIVKHWAKSRGVNVTYQGTLSSYAYVLMCVHFLQQRKPAILPCLQGMEATYVVSIDDIECAFFDQVESLRGFGDQNKESIAQLVWAFFDYWAFRHDYANAVISVRIGSIISKREKEWTRRIGNDRHLICIEDPFEVSHDLGRVVDKYSIKILREEFERAADILQYDPDPCSTLFEPYIPPPS